MPIVKNIIFDLGNVIINIDPNLTAEALNALAGYKRKEAQKALTFENFYNPYEMGKINDDEFLSTLQQFAMNRVTRQQIVDAWNAMLLDVPVKRIDMIKELQSNYDLFVLSNTNQLHINAFNKILNDTCGLPSIEPLMVKAYYSHNTGFRKPMKEIFQLVIDEQKLNPEESLFIDDVEKYVLSAQSCGLMAKHNPPGVCFTQWLPGFLKEK